MDGKELSEAHPPLLNSWLPVDSGGGAAIVFGCVPTRRAQQGPADRAKPTVTQMIMVKLMESLRDKERT